MGINNAIVKWVERTTHTAAFKVTNATSKGAKIDRFSVFSLPTDSYSPKEPGSWDVYQNRADIKKPRLFSEQEAMILANELEVHEQKVTATKEAYKHLEKIKKLDTQVNEAHNGYASVAVGENMNVLGSKAKHANETVQAGLALRGMEIGLDSQIRVADKQIELIEEKFKAVW